MKKTQFLAALLATVAACTDPDIELQGRWSGQWTSGPTTGNLEVTFSEKGHADPRPRQRSPQFPSAQRRRAVRPGGHRSGKDETGSSRPVLQRYLGRLPARGRVSVFFSESGAPRPCGSRCRSWATTRSSTPTSTPRSRPAWPFGWGASRA